MKKYSLRRFIFLSIPIVILGIALLLRSQALTQAYNLEPESASGNAVIGNSADASNRTYVNFGTPIPFGGASPGGTYADWYYPGTGLNSIEWTQVPTQDPDISLTSANLLHYYAYTFSSKNSTSSVGFGYAGFQTNGNLLGIFRGKGINYSFWGSSDGHTSGAGLINARNVESGGYQIFYPYVWIVGHVYNFQLKLGPSGSDSTGKWWGLYMTDQNTAITTFIGEEKMPLTINGADSSILTTQTGNFGEDTHWWRSLTGTTKYNCSDFQKSSMVTKNVTANGGTVRPTNFTHFVNNLAPSTGDNGYKTTNCPVSEYTDNNMNIQMNLGYWNPGANNYLQ